MAKAAPPPQIRGPIHGGLRSRGAAAVGKEASVMADDEVTRNLKGMDELDFVGWNSADWHGVFAHYHTDDVLVDVHGQAQTHGIQEHIDAMRAFVETTSGT